MSCLIWQLELLGKVTIVLLSHGIPAVHYYQYVGFPDNVEISFSIPIPIVTQDDWIPTKLHKISTQLQKKCCMNFTTVSTQIPICP